MSEPSLTFAVPSEEEIFALLREERLRRTRCGRRQPLAVRVLQTVGIVVAIAVVGVGVTANVQYDQQQQLAAARADYDSAVSTLESVYEQNRASAKDLGKTVREAGSFVGTALDVLDSVNGYADANALTELVNHTAELSDAISAPAGAATHSDGAPETLGELRTAAMVARFQTTKNREVLQRTRTAVAAVKRASSLAHGDIASVASSVPAVASALVDANREAKKATRAQLEDSAAGVQTALATGGDVPAALTFYGQCARAFQDSATTQTGEPAVTVVSTVAVPQMPAQVAAIVAASPEHRETTLPPAVQPAQPSQPAQPAAPPAAVAIPAAPASPSAPASVPPFAINILAHGQYTPGCPRLGVVGAGFAYGPTGTTKQQIINYGFRYDYTVEQKSTTAVAWTAFKCQTGNDVGRR